MLLLLLSCWRPNAYVPPEPSPEVQAVMEDPAEEAVAEAPEETTAEAGDPEEPEEEKPAMQPYAGRVITSPATLVDDLGRPVLVIEKAPTQVEVRAEEDIRKKVYCGSCKPVGEGWIQASLVEKI